jgi:NACHT domain
MESKNLKSRISELLSRFITQIDLDTKAGRTDINRDAETVLIPLLNEIFDYNLKNLNDSEGHDNYPAIDLGDKIKKVAVQVTATSNSKKVKKTLQGFIKHEHYKTYDRVIIFNLIKKQKRYSGKGFEEITQDKFLFNRKQDILDSGDLVKQISNFQVEQLQRICDVLEANFGQDQSLHDREQTKTKSKTDVLREKLDASRVWCVERFAAAILDLEEADKLADDLSLGQSPKKLDLSPGKVFILIGDYGIGKTLILQRIYQSSINYALKNDDFQIPIFINAQQWKEQGSLQEIFEECADEIGIPVNRGGLIIIDELDAVTEQEGIKLLLQARAITQNPERKDNTCVIVASRPTRWISSFYENDKTVISVQANELNETEVFNLLCRISKTELNRILFYSDSFRLLAHTIKKPLFSLILGKYLRRSSNNIPKTDGELLMWLVEEAFKLSNISEIEKMLLIEIGYLSVTYGGSVLKTEISSQNHELDRLLETGLVVEQGEKSISFVLPIFSQYFAALRLKKDPSIVSDLVKDPTQLQKWAYPLMMAISQSEHRTVAKILIPIVERYPSFAIELIQKESTRFGNKECALPPSYECGQQIHTAMCSWVIGLAPLSKLIAPLRVDGRVRSIGIFTQGTYLEWAWYMGTEDKEVVTDLPKNYDHCHHNSEWFGGFCQRGNEPAWAWRWTLEQLIGRLRPCIDAARFAVENVNLAREAAWSGTLAILRTLRINTWQVEQIAIEIIEPKLREIERENVIIGGVVWGGADPSVAEHDYYFNELRREINSLYDSGELMLKNPWVGPNLNLSRAGHISNFYTTEQLQTRIMQVYKAALDVYQLLTQTWFQPLMPNLDIAVSLPAKLVGVIYPNNIYCFNPTYDSVTKGLNDDPPELDCFLQPLPRGQKNDVFVKIGMQFPDNEFEKEYEKLQPFMRYRPEASLRVRRAFTKKLHLRDEIFSATPVMAIVFQWLKDDLTRAGWGSFFLSRRMFSRR